jgi:hypothetical protein
MTHNRSRDKRLSDELALTGPFEPSLFQAGHDIQRCNDPSMPGKQQG